MQIVRIQVVGGNEQATGLLKDSPYRGGIQDAVSSALVQIQAQAGAEADCAHYRPIRGAVLRGDEHGGKARAAAGPTLFFDSYT